MKQYQVRSPVVGVRAQVRMRTFAASMLLALPLYGCTGTIGDAVNGQGSPGGSNGGDSPQGGESPPLVEVGETPKLCTSPKPGLMLNRRLTPTQFDNAIAQLFPNAGTVAHGFPKTSIREGYRSFIDANSVTADGAEQISSAVTVIANKVTTDAKTLTGCTPGATADDACARGYLERLARKAYRRPLQSGELDTLTKTYGKLIAAQFTPAESLAAAIEVVLQSPQFLYISQLGKINGSAGEVVALSDHEVAARLSFFLWDAPPDDALAKLADDGQLRNANDVEAQARKMVADPRAENVLAQFLEDWLELYRLDSQTKDAKRFPEWNAALATAMRAEISKAATEITFRQDGSLSTLLAGTRTMANGPLAAIYGADPKMGDKFESIELNASQRAGLLTSAAFLASHAGSQESFPVARGVFVRRHMLCQDIVLPNDIDIKPPAVDPNVRGRERYNQHRDDPKCAGCHALMDPIGFGLEGYDAVGRFRTTEGNNLTVDSSGELVEAGSVSGKFNGGPELAKKLAESPAVQACFARQMFSFAIARAYGDEDSCALAFIESKFAESKGSIKELFVAMSSSDNFLFRRVPQ